MHKLILMKIPYFKPLIMKNSFFKIENIIEMDVDSEGWDIIVEYLYLKYEKDDIKQSDEDFVMKYREDKVAIALLVLKYGIFINISLCIPYSFIYYCNICIYLYFH